MKSHTLQLHPSQNMNPPFVQLILPVSHIVTVLFIRWKYHSSCLQVTLFYLIMAPKHKSSDAGISDSLLLCLIYKLNFIIGVCV